MQKSPENWKKRFVTGYIYAGKGKISLRGSSGKVRGQKLEELSEDPVMQKELERKFKAHWSPLVDDLKLATAKRYGTRILHFLRAVKPLNKYVSRLERILNVNDYRILVTNSRRMFAEIGFPRANIMKDLVEKIAVNVRPKIFWRFLTTPPRHKSSSRIGTPEEARLRRDWNDYVFGKTTNDLMVILFVFLFEVVEMTTRKEPLERLKALNRMLEYSYTGKTETPLIRKRVLLLPAVDNILRRLLTDIRPEIDLSGLPDALDDIILAETDRVHNEEAAAEREALAQQPNVVEREQPDIVEEQTAALCTDMQDFSQDMQLDWSGESMFSDDMTLPPSFAESREVLGMDSPPMPVPDVVMPLPPPVSQPPTAFPSYVPVAAAGDWQNDAPVSDGSYSGYAALAGPPALVPQRQYTQLYQQPQPSQDGFLGFPLVGGNSSVGGSGPTDSNALMMEMLQNQQMLIQTLTQQNRRLEQAKSMDGFAFGNMRQPPDAFGGPSRQPQNYGNGGFDASSLPSFYNYGIGPDLPQVEQFGGSFAAGGPAAMAQFSNQAYDGVGAPSAWHYGGMDAQAYVGDPLSAGGTIEHGNDMDVEMTPAMAVEPPPNLSFGSGWDTSGFSYPQF